MFNRIPYHLITILTLATIAFSGCEPAARPDVTIEPPALTELPGTALPPTEALTNTPEQPTSEGTAEPEPTGEHPHASPNVVYQTTDNTLMSFVSGTGESWVFTGLGFPLSLNPPNPISAFETNLYVLGSEQQGEPLQLFEVTPVMPRPLSIHAQGEPRSIAVVFKADTPDIWLAVGLIDRTTDPYTARLVLQIVDAPEAQVIAEQSTETYSWFAPLRWSSDAQRLYYSQEPEGLGGYILFDGWSSLSVYDVTAENSRVVVPSDPFIAICLDDLSPDEQWVVHHCDPGVGIGLIDAATGEQSGVIAPPAEIAGDVAQMGSARFSPDGTRIAFALARGNPDQEQGWVAVADDLSGTSRLVLTSEPTHYYQVKGWLDDQTLVVQELSIEMSPQLWLVPLDGGEAQWIGEGNFVALIPALVP